MTDSMTLCEKRFPLTVSTLGLSGNPTHINARLYYYKSEWNRHISLSLQPEKREERCGYVVYSCFPSDGIHIKIHQPSKKNTKLFNLMGATLEPYLSQIVEHYENGRVDAVKEILRDVLTPLIAKH